MNKFFHHKTALKSIMQAIRIEKFGGPQVLQLQTVDLPEVPEDKALVKIFSAGVNPVDTYIREGLFHSRPQLPYTPGKDGAGLIHSVGDKFKSLQQGDRVFVCGRSLGTYGTYAEYSLVSKEDVFPLPDNLSFDQGAAIGIPYFTAYRALVIKCKCQSDETVLIHGASGAVGLAAVQIAKHLGLRVIGTAGTQDGMDLVKETGAHYVLSHREEGYLEKVAEITEDKGVDIVIEMLANVNLDKDLDILGSRGRLAIVGSRGSIEIDPRKMMMPEIEVYGIALMSSNKAEWGETAEAIQKLCVEGCIKPVIHKKYPLSSASEAHKDVIDSKGAKGKLILTVHEED